MMDGIALSFSDFDSGTRSFPLQATQAAGDEQLSLEDGKCIEIMTGAALPYAADCIIPVERISVNNGNATIEAGYKAKQEQFIHPCGSDHKAGSELLSAGKRISPMDIAIINSCGLTEVDVSKSPTIREPSRRVRHSYCRRSHTPAPLPPPKVRTARRSPSEFRHQNQHTAIAAAHTSA